MNQNNWVFQLSRNLNSGEKTIFQGKMDEFLVQWHSHGAPVPGTCEVRFDRFILVQTAPGSTSGCSIDALTSGLNKILLEMGLKLLGPDHVFYLDETGDLLCVDFRELEKACAKGWLTGETTVFDSSLGQKGDINLWQVKLKDTWMSRFLPKTHA